MRDFEGSLLSLKPFRIPGMVPLTPLGKSRRLAQGRRLKFCLRLGFWSSPRSPIRSSSLRRVLPRVPSARALVSVSGTSLIFALAFCLCFGGASRLLLFGHLSACPLLVACLAPRSRICLHALPCHHGLVLAFLFVGVVRILTHPPAPFACF